MQNNFLKMLENSKQADTFPVGSWLMSASPVVAEGLAWAGFDWTVLDMEHTPIDMMTLVHLLQALAARGELSSAQAPIVPIVRVPWNDAVMVKRVMDAGAQHIMFPFVENAQEAQAAARSMRYAPEGVRGMAAMGRASHFGTIPQYFKMANQAVSCIVQIESPQAVEQADSIAAVQGVDALFIGPGDLSGAMGHVGDLMHPEVLALTQQAVDRAHQVGKPIGTVGATPEAVQTYREMGFDFLACASDLGLLMRSFSHVLTQIRQRKHASAGAPSAQGPTSTDNNKTGAY